MKGFVLNIFHKILLGNLLIALVSLAGLFYLINNAQNDRLDSVENELRLEANAIAKEITSWADMNRRILTQNSLSTDMQSMETARQTPILKNMLESYEWSYLVYATGFDGFMTARSDDKDILKADGSKAHFRGDRGYFKEIMDGNPIGQSVVMSRTINRPVYVLCVPMDGAVEAEDNVLCVASKLEDISKIVADTKLGKTGYAFLTSSDDRLIASGNFSGETNDGLQDMSDHPTIANSVPNQLYTFNEGDKTVVSYSVEAGFGWRLVIQQDYDEVFQPVTAAKYSAWFTIALTVLAIVFLAMFFSRELSLSIRKLTSLADDYSKGEFDKVNTSLTRTDEVGDLARAIDRMGKSIRIAISRLSDK